MRRIIYILSIITLSIVSCNKIDEEQPNDNEVTLQYRVSCDALTKSIGYGEAVNYVSYAVYLKRGDSYDFVSSFRPVAFSATGEAICPVVLAKDQTYKVVFVAQHYNEKGESTYTVDFRNKMLTMPAEAVANSENYDLFHTVSDIIEFNGTQHEPVELVRIVAQVNLYCSQKNWEEAIRSGRAPEYSDITIDRVPVSFNLIDGTVSADTKTVTYSKDSVPGNAHLAYAYCLAGGTADAMIRLYKNNTDNDPFVITSPEIPVEKNKMTKIHGAIIY